MGSTLRRLGPCSVAQPSGINSLHSFGLLRCCYPVWDQLSATWRTGSVARPNGSTLYHVTPGQTSNPRGGHASRVQAWTEVQEPPRRSKLRGNRKPQNPAVLFRPARGEQLSARGVVQTHHGNNPPRESERPTPNTQEAYPLGVPAGLSPKPPVEANAPMAAVGNEVHQISFKRDRPVLELVRAFLCSAFCSFRDQLSA